MNTSIPAAWYADPAGSGGQRWWDGTAWSAHVRPTEPAVPTVPPAAAAAMTFPTAPAALTFPTVPPAQAFPTAPTAPTFPSGPTFPSAQGAQPAAFQPYQGAQQAAPMASGPVYRPFDGQASRPSASWYEDSKAAPAMVNNSAGWTSLIAGMIGLGIVVVTSMLGQKVYVLYFPLIVAVISGVRAFAQRASGTSTSFFAPLLGILSSLVAAGLFISVLLTGALPWETPIDSKGPIVDSTEQAIDESAVLDGLIQKATDIGVGILDEYPDLNWPETLVADAAGRLVLDGVVLATIESDEVFTYTLTGQDFTFTLESTVTGQQVNFDSATSELTAKCRMTDRSCNSL